MRRRLRRCAVRSGTASRRSDGLARRPECATVGELLRQLARDVYGPASCGSTRRRLAGRYRRGAGRLESSYPSCRLFHCLDPPLPPWAVVPTFTLRCPSDFPGILPSAISTTRSVSPHTDVLTEASSAFGSRPGVRALPSYSTIVGRGPRQARRSKILRRRSQQRSAPVCHRAAAVPFEHCERLPFALPR